MITEPCANCSMCIEQPPLWEHTSVDGVFIKQMYLEKVGTLIPQHAHRYPHTTMLARGKMRIWKEGVLLGDFEAPFPIYIEARVKHTLMSLEDNTLAYCIHNSSRTGTVEVHEEHQLCTSV